MNVPVKFKLCKAKRGWYAYADFEEGQKRISEIGGIRLNKIQNEKEREIQYNSLIRTLNDKVKYEDWNPFTEVKEIKKSHTFISGLEAGLQLIKEREKPLSEKTISMYGLSVSQFIEVIEELSWIK